MRKARVGALCLSLGALAACSNSSFAVGVDPPEDTEDVGLPRSEQTPEGLHFRAVSASPFPGKLTPIAPPVAVGGTQTIFAFWDNDAEQPFALPFYPSTDGALRWTTAYDSAVVVIADAEGSGVLELLEPEGRAFYDRIELESRVVTDTWIIPLDPSLLFDEAPATEPWALFASTEIPMGMVLLSGEERLVDESVELSVSGDASSQESEWNRVTLKTGSSGSVMITATSPARPSASRTFPITSKGDSIVALSGLEEGLENFRGEVGEMNVACFSLLDQGTHVAGATWTFSSENETLHMGELDANCVSFWGTVPGQETLTVEAGGVSQTFTVEVGP